MAQPAVRNLVVTRGDCLPIKAVYRAAGVPVDLTGYTIRWDFKWGPKPEEELSVTLTGNTLGEISGRAPGQSTELFGERDTTKHALRITAPDGCVKTILRGKVDVEQ